MYFPLDKQAITPTGGKLPARIAESGGRGALRLVSFLLMLAGLTTFGTAKDRALLIGIDFYEEAAPTPGSTNDTALIEEFLIKKLDFSRDSIHKLSNEAATASRIKAEFQKWLVDETQPGDRVFVHYSGHGSQVPDENGDEADGRDEILAAYDVRLEKSAIPGQPAAAQANFILDDEINRWLVELRGRRVMMVFDSCHSGTIYRSGNSPRTSNSRFLRAKDAAPQMRSGRAEAVYSPDAPLGRELTTVKDNFLDGSLSGMTIITAAKPGQEAFPIFEQNRFIGALTYLFVEKQKNGLLPLAALTDSLAQGMDELKNKGLLEAGRNGKFQEPEIEIFGEPAAAGRFVSPDGWAAAPAALVNPLSTVKLSITTPANKTKYKIGEVIPFAVASSAPGYLYVLVFSRDDVATCLFLNAGDADNRISAGTVQFPPSKEKEYDVVAQEPVGKDVWVALLTDKPLKLGDKEVYSWSDIFARVGLPKLQQAIAAHAQTRGAGTRPVLNEWQAAVLVVEVER